MGAEQQRGGTQREEKGAEIGGEKRGEQQLAGEEQPVEQPGVDRAGDGAKKCARTEIAGGKRGCILPDRNRRGDHQDGKTAENHEPTAPDGNAGIEDPVKGERSAGEVEIHDGKNQPPADDVGEDVAAQKTPAAGQ